MLNILLWLVFGAVAGWLASKIMHSKTGVVTNILLGIIGSLVGGGIARLIGIYTKGFSLGALLIAVLGACLLIFIYRKIKK